MTQANATWFLIAVALIMANIPWLSERFLFIWKQGSGIKTFRMRLFEWLLLFILTGAIATGMEKKLYGDIHVQSWEFYVVTYCMFLVLSFPGFIIRYQFLKLLAHRATNRTP